MEKLVSQLYIDKAQNHFQWVEEQKFNKRFICVILAEIAKQTTDLNIIEQLAEATALAIQMDKIIRAIGVNQETMFNVSIKEPEPEPIPTEPPLTEDEFTRALKAVDAQQANADAPVINSDY